MSKDRPSRGEVWMVDLDPTRGHEQAGLRPGLIVSVDAFNHGPAGLVILVPITMRDKSIPFHVRIEPEEGGLSRVSFAKSEDVRWVSCERLVRRLGSVSAETMTAVADGLRVLLNL